MVIRPNRDATRAAPERPVPEMPSTRRRRLLSSRGEAPTFNVTAAQRAVASAMLIGVLCSGAFPGAGQTGILTGAEAEKGRRLYEDGCLPDPGYLPETCTKAIALLADAVKNHPRPLTENLMLARALRTKSYFDARDPEDAASLQRRSLRHYEDALAIDPDNAEALRALAMAMAKPDQGSQIESLKALVKKYPGRADSYLTLANIHRNRGELDLSAEYFLGYLARNENLFGRDAMRSVILINALIRSGEKDLAREVLSRTNVALRRVSRYERCEGFALLDKEIYSAFPILGGEMRKLRRYCSNVAHRNKAVKLLNEGRIDEAETELHLQLRENPFYGETYSLLEGIYRKKKDREKGLRIVKRYFDFESDREEKCRAYRHWNLKTYKAMDDYFRELDNECSG